MIYVNFDIKINDKGEFMSVVYENQVYSIDDWNKKISSTPLERKGNSNSSNGSSNNSSGNLREMFPRVEGPYGIVLHGGWEAIEESMDNQAQKY